jgi:transcriptional regulator with XRE-family HTH domain
MEGGGRGIGERVRSLRRQRRWTAQRLAEECARIGMPSLTRGTLAKIESGVRKSVTAEELVVLARSLGVAVSDLLDSGPGTDAAADPADGTARVRERHGLIFVSIGGPPNRPNYERSSLSPPLSGAGVLGEYVRDGYVERGDLAGVAEDIRDQARAWAEDPRYSVLHLFYRGPVAIAPLLGRLLAAAKPLVVYHFEGGRYFPAYTIDRQFLYPRPAKQGG